MSLNKISEELISEDIKVHHNNSNKLYIETYGCQMNVADSEVVASILCSRNYSLVNEAENADVILINTCSIRENAEQKIRNRLNHLKSIKKRNKDLVVGVIGCMAEFIKEKLFEEADH